MHFGLAALIRDIPGLYSVLFLNHSVLIVSLFEILTRYIVNLSIWYSHLLFKSRFLMNWNYHIPTSNLGRMGASLKFLHLLSSAINTFYPRWFSYVNIFCWSTLRVILIGKFKKKNKFCKILLLINKIMLVDKIQI